LCCDNGSNNFCVSAIAKKMFLVIDCACEQRLLFGFIPDMSGIARFSATDPEMAAQLYGRQNRYLKQVERALGIRIGSNGLELTFTGDAAQVLIGRRVFEELQQLLREGMPIYPPDVDYAVRIICQDSSTCLREIFLDTVFISARKKLIGPKTLAQKTYIDAIRAHHVVFGIGPAGTGKTYLAMAMGVAALLRKDVSRILLVRPAVEAGEKLGFLPGDLAEKVNPYLRPLYDALFDMLEPEHGKELVANGTVEVAPLAFMRGRTLNDAFVILDEAQNTTIEQMKMFLTRLGFGSQAVVTGDVTQVDLPDRHRSGLLHATEVLAGVTDIHFNFFTDVDVVRHPIVQSIVQAYQVADRRTLRDVRQA
jgi:phosphate starvation-inducible PhoH-like protein